MTVLKASKSFWRRLLIYEIGYLLFFTALFLALHLAHVSNALRATVCLFLVAQAALIVAKLIDAFSSRKR